MKLEFQQAFIEKFSSERMLKLAKHIWDNLDYWKESRKPREKYVRQCDEAYLCHRYVPDTGALQLIEDGEFGESDVHDNMNLMSIRQALALMPRKWPWLTIGSREGEAEKLISAIQDHQIFMHKRAKTRRNVQRHMKQKNVRGRSAIYWEWREEIVWRRVDDVDQNETQLNKFLIANNMTAKDAKRMTSGRYPHIIDQGPLIMPLDYYDLWVDPAADIINSRRPAKAIRRFRVKAELLAQRNEKQDKPLYDPEIIKGLKEYTLEEIYGSEDHAGGRAGSMRIFGTLPTRGEHSLKIVPVYIVYMPIVELEVNGVRERWFDTYFHVAYSDDQHGPVLIHAEENPSDLGHSRILIDDAIDWFTPWGSGGIGLVEKQLSKLNQKNLIQLLMITAAAHAIIPPQLVMNNAFKDDEEISYLPGALNLVQENPFGMDVLRPMITPQSGAQFGEQLLRFYGEEMRAASGVDGLASDNGARSLTKPKTATEVNRDMSSGSLYLDNQAENDAELLSELCQAVYEESQNRLIPDREGMLEYERYLGDKVVQGKLAFKDFVVPRSIQVMGVSGAENRAQDMANLLQGLDIAGRTVSFWPGAIPFLQVAMVAAWRKLDIPMPDEIEKFTTPAMQQAAQLEEQMPGLLQGMMGELSAQGVIPQDGQQQPPQNPAAGGGAQGPPVGPGQ